MNEWFGFKYYDMNPPEDSWLRISFDNKPIATTTTTAVTQQQQQQQPSRQQQNEDEQVQQLQQQQRSSSRISALPTTNSSNNNNNNNNNLNNNTSTEGTSEQLLNGTELQPVRKSCPWLLPGEKVITRVIHVGYIQCKHFIDHEHCYTTPDLSPKKFPKLNTITNNTAKRVVPPQPTSSKRKILHGSLYITNFRLHFVQEKFADDSDDEDGRVNDTFSTSMSLAHILTIDEKLVQDSSIFRNYSSSQISHHHHHDTPEFFANSTLSLHLHHNTIHPSNIHQNATSSTTTNNINNTNNTTSTSTTTDHADKVNNVLLLDHRSMEEQCSGILHIHGKDVRTMKIAFFGSSRTSRKTQKELTEVAWSAQTALKELNHILLNWKMAKNLFAFQFGTGKSLTKYFSPQQTRDGWEVYDMKRDFERQGLQFDNNNTSPFWRISDVNANYQICETYPKYLVVPACISDEQLRSCAQFRSKGRIPALTWIHPSKNGGSILRCSQPMVGVMRSRSREDEDIIDAVRRTTQAQRVHIIDCRPKANALAQTVMGRGYEDMTYYVNCSIEFMGIDNIHAMNSSLQTLMKLCQKPGDIYWLSSLESTGWLRHSRLILQCAQRIVELVEQKRTAVIIHCSDGWDRTSQVAALAELLLDPYYRTIRGFEALIEKEWCSFGHKFCDRIGHLRNASLSDEVSPVFLQFIDCVWQVLQQFPQLFEFNEYFLITILDHLYSCLFGNFLHNCDRERELDNTRTNTVSLWSFINSKENRHRYVNSLYDREMIQKSRKVLIPDCDIETLSVNFWIGYFYRYRMGMKAKYQMLMYRVLNNYQQENDQIKKTLANETSQRKELQKELQMYKKKEMEWKRWFEQSGAPPILSEENGNDGVILTRLTAGNEHLLQQQHHQMLSSQEEDDVEEQAHMNKSVRFMENYF
jgi:type II secretory pathway pseudopilin PulG/rhodanese-related sulfurtransferase